MNINAIHSLTLQSPELDAASSRSSPSPEQRRAAEQFEAIFLRQLMKGLETSSGFQSDGSGRVYRSMMVGALADTAAEGGGIGLSELVLRALMASPSAETSAETSGSASTVPGAPNPHQNGTT